MGASFIYLKLEIKKVCKILPSFLAGAIVLALLLGAVAFSANRVLYGESVVGRITVGVVLGEEDLIAGKALSMLSSMESVKSVCDFVYVDEAEGKQMLKEGTLYALLVVPGTFVEDIMSGVNTPVSIVFSDQKGIETMMFQELTDAGVRTLGVAQAAIYAADEFCTLNLLSSSIPQVEQVLNQIYLSYALPREDYFRYQMVSAVGDVSMLQYYGISAAVLFMLLCGIPAAAVLKPSSQVFQQKIKTIGIRRWQVIGCRILSASLLLGIVCTLGVCGAMAVKAIMFNWKIIPAGILVCLASASMIVFFYEVSGSRTTGVMLLFLSVTGMLFLSGGFLPSVFLPQGLRQLSPFMPTTLLLEVLKGLITSEFSWESMGWLAVMGTGFFGVSVMVRR